MVHVSNDEMTVVREVDSSGTGRWEVGGELWGIR